MGFVELARTSIKNNMAMLGSRTTVKGLLLNYRYAKRNRSKYEQLKAWRKTRSEKRIKTQFFALIIFGVLCLVASTIALKFFAG